MKKTSAFICLAALGAVSMNAAPLLYDLGTPGSPVRKNFVPLDIKSKVWSSKTKLFVKTNKIVRESGVNRNSGRAEPPLYFNELTCDHIGRKGRWGFITGLGYKSMERSCQCCYDLCRSC